MNNFHLPNFGVPNPGRKPDWTLYPPEKPPVYYYIFRMLLFAGSNQTPLTSMWALKLDNLITFYKEKEIMEGKAMEMDNGYIPGRDTYFGSWTQVTREEYKAYIGEDVKDAV